MVSYQSVRWGNRYPDSERPQVHSCSSQGSGFQADMQENERLCLKTAIRPIMMYGCEAWTPTLKEEDNLLVAGRKKLRRNIGTDQNSRRELKGKEEFQYWWSRVWSQTEGSCPSPILLIGETKASRFLGMEREWEKIVLWREHIRDVWDREDTKVQKELSDLDIGNWRELTRDREIWHILMTDANQIQFE